MANFTQNFRAGQAMGRERRLQDEAIAKQNQLARLAGDAFSASPESRSGILAEIARLDPQSAFEMQGTFDQQQQRAEATQQQRLSNMAKLLSVAPQQARGGLYARMRPGLQQMGFDAPEAWDDSLLPVVQSLGGVQNENFRPMVVAPGSALVGPDGRVVFQNPGREDPGTLVDVPVVRNGVPGTEKRIWRGGQLLPLDQALPGSRAPAGSAPAQQPSTSPVMDSVLARANDMARRGVPDAEIERFIATAAQQGGVRVTPSQAQLDANAQRTLDSQTYGAPAPAPAPAAGSPDSVGFTPDPAQPRMATAAELAQLGYGPTDIVEINASGIPRPIRVAEAPGAKAPGSEAANKVSLYDNALRAAQQWRDLVVTPDGRFNDIAARTPQAQALLNQALRAKLRAESGASISPEEIAGETDRYRGSLFASDSTAVQQANALIEDLTNQRAALDPAGQIQPVIPSGGPRQAAAPAAPAPAAGGIRIISVTPAGQR